ncbi:hypothetical protein SE19_00780 [Acidiplasma aeolicum]|uniref:DUF4382 domain-containing protein n=1 Tax=Acidiplasma aeolicum TaxID=507754 RepID=A0A0P9ETR0_9ARCH|nr:DUF4382 domain-containing protein [Acidiplasma aeolicum]KPV47502.1 hypothetical protein SE19_00780 [Acidiplasma aeolicum]
MNLKKIIAVAIIIIVIGGIAYYGYDYETHGTLRLEAADSGISLSGATGVYITFSAIALHYDKASSNSTGWYNYSLHDKTVNIFDVVLSNATFLSNITVHSGTFNMIKIYISKVTIDILGKNITLKLAHSFALVINTLSVSHAGTTTAIMEFNLTDNIHLSSSTAGVFNMSASVIVK